MKQKSELEEYIMKYKTQLILIAGLILMGWLLTACEGPDQPTYDKNNPDPNPAGLAAAVIDSLSPNLAYLKDIITINGQGFNSNPKFNVVSFGSYVGTVMEATPTMLNVQAPNVSDETVNVKVAVKGAEFWSNELEFTFKPAVERIDEEIVWPNGVAVDSEENVYVGSASDEVIYKITPDHEKTEFTQVPISGAMEFGPDGYLYVCLQNDNKIVRVSPDGETVEDVVEVDAPIDFDWDANKNMYVVSNSIGIVTFNSAGTQMEVDSIASPKCVRVFGNHVYVSDIWDGNILRYEITASGLENEEVFLEGDSPLGIEFDADGTMYYTEAWETSLYTVSPDGDTDVLFEGQLETPMHYLTFFGKAIYIVFPGWGDVGVVLKTYIGVEQAPNYGRQ
jgi:sugar lactone lactonase YvrE